MSQVKLSLTIETELPYLSISFITVCIPNGLTYPSRTLALLVKPSHAVPYEQGKEAAVT